MKILLVDNYDSFTYNLVHILRSFEGVEVDVVKNDQVDFSAAAGYDKIVLSPGPGIPKEAGQLMEVIHQFHGSKPLLGVCLGHQAMAEYFGGSLLNLPQVFHGVATPCALTDTGTAQPIFAGLPAAFEVGRYHSWVANSSDFPQALSITAVDDAGMIMALQHKTFSCTGVQFHPESILTPLGKQMLENWVKA